MRSIIGWPGGKSLLAKRIVEKIPQHKTYVEPFGGAAWVLFAKSPDWKQWSKSRDYREIYNDYNGELVSFWRYVRKHPEALAAEIDQQMASREGFLSAIAKKPETELERAVMFYLRLALSFSGLGGTFAANYGRVFPLRKTEKVQAAARRFSNVIIENESFQYVIRRYDSPDTLFYVDPPYYGHEDIYERDGTPGFEQHEELATSLRSINGRFILSYNDHEFIRALYDGCKMETLDVRYTISSQTNRTKKTELLIRNY